MRSADDDSFDLTVHEAYCVVDDPKIDLCICTRRRFHINHCPTECVI